MGSNAPVHRGPGWTCIDAPGVPAMTPRRNPRDRVGKSARTAPPPLMSSGPDRDPRGDAQRVVGRAVADHCMQSLDARRAETGRWADRDADGRDADGTVVGEVEVAPDTQMFVRQVVALEEKPGVVGDTGASEITNGSTGLGPSWSPPESSRSSTVSSCRGRKPRMPGPRPGSPRCGPAVPRAQRRRAMRRPRGWSGGRFHGTPSLCGADRTTSGREVARWLR